MKVLKEIFLLEEVLSYGIWELKFEALNKMRKKIEEDEENEEEGLSLMYSNRSGEGIVCQ